MRRLVAGGAVLAVHEVPCGRRFPVAECGRCGHVRALRGRGLCAWCKKAATADGTIGQYGYVKADRMADYAELRASLGAAEAARRVGVSRRTAHRYDAALRERERPVKTEEPRS